MTAATAKTRAATIWAHVRSEHTGFELLLELAKPVLVGVLTIDNLQHGQWTMEALGLTHAELLVAGYLVLSFALFVARPHLKGLLFPLSLFEAFVVALIYGFAATGELLSFRLLAYLSAAGMGARLSSDRAGVAASGIWAMTSLRTLVAGEMPFSVVGVISALLSAVGLLLVAMLGHHLVLVDQQRVRHQADAAAVYEMTRAVSASLDPSVVTRTLTREVSHIFAGCACVIASADDDSTDLIVADVYAEPPLEPAPLKCGGRGVRLPLAAGGLLARVFGSQRPATADRLDRDASLHWLAGGERKATALAAPLVLKRQTRGVMAVVAADGRAFDKHHERLLETAAAHAATAIDHARLYEAAEREAVVLSRLYEFSRSLSETHGAKHRLHLVAEMSKRLVGGEAAVVLAAQAGGNVFVPVDFSGSTAAAFSEFALASDHPDLAPILEEGKPVAAPPGLALPDGEIKPYAVMPLSRNDRLLGVLLVAKPSGQSFTFSDLQVLFMVAQHGTLSIENARRFEDAQHWAVSDGLTGLVNHRHFQERLRQQVIESERYETSTALLMMDVDHFKHLNDSEGHPKGDALLRAVAEVLRRQCRRSDVLARYGGDEFAVIATHTGAAEAAVLAERIRADVEALTDVGHSPLRTQITLSIGLAAYPEHARSASELVDAADRALAAAKQAGRNRVVIWEAEPAETPA